MFFTTVGSERIEKIDGRVTQIKEAFLLRNAMFWDDMLRSAHENKAPPNPGRGTAHTFVETGGSRACSVTSGGGLSEQDLSIEADGREACCPTGLGVQR